MDMFIICVLIYTVLITVELIPIYKKKDWKLFWFYTIIIVITFSNSIAYGFGVKIPSPAEPIKKIVTIIWGL